MTMTMLDRLPRLRRLPPVDERTTVKAGQAPEPCRRGAGGLGATLVAAMLTLGVSLHGLSDKRAGAHRVRDVTYALAALTGLAGTGFHF